MEKAATRVAAVWVFAYEWRNAWIIRNYIFIISVV
jgi:hypothetical protein